MDSFDVRAVTAELQCLVGGYFNKAYQEGSEVVLRIRTEKNHDLVFKDGAWLFITACREKGGEHPPTFAMTLRKHLGNKRLVAIRQQDFDRIVSLEFSNGYRLIAELFGEGNLILLNEQGTIILPLHTQSWSHRELRPGRPYALPPARNDPFATSFEDFAQTMASSDTDVVRTLVMDINIPGDYSEHICDRAGVDRHAPARGVEEGEMQRLYGAMEAVLLLFREHHFSPVLVKQGDTYVNVFPIRLPAPPDATLEERDTVNAAYDAYVCARTPPREEDAYQEERQRLLRQIKQQQSALQRFQEEREARHRAGDAIYAHYQLCERLLASLAEGGEADTSVVRRYVYPRAEVSLPYRGEEVIVTLDVTKNVAQNANDQYEAEKKIRDKMVGAEEALERTRRQLQEMRHAPPSPPPSHSPRPVRTWWFEAFRWCLSSEGNLLLCGRDAPSNEKVVKKYLEPGDRYVHADLHGAPSCVVKASDARRAPLPISERTLEEACQMALAYSRAWGQFASGSAYWVTPEQVSKTPQAGESLPTGAFVIRGKRHYCKCPVRLAVGEVEVMDTSKVMGGPPAAVERHASRWVLMEAGREDPNRVAARLAAEFGVRVEEVQRVMPPGPVRVVEEHP